MGGVCELGEKLRRAREARGLSLEEAARRARLSRAYLEALEECRFEALPEPALTRAHLRRLAGILGLEPEALVALYPTEEKPPAPPAPSRRGPLLWWLLLPLVLALFVGGYLLFRPAPEGGKPPEKPAKTAEVPKNPPAPARVRLAVRTEPPGAKVYLDGYFLGEAPVELEVEAGRRLLRVEAEGYLPHEQPVDLNTDRALTLRLVPKPKKKEKPPEAPPPKTLTLRVTARSWLRVTTPEGKRLYERTAPPGTELSFELPVVVKTGNAGGVRVFLGEEDLGPMGKPGEVVTRRFEAPEKTE